MFGHFIEQGNFKALVFLYMRVSTSILYLSISALSVSVPMLVCVRFVCVYVYVYVYVCVHVYKPCVSTPVCVRVYMCTRLLACLLDCECAFEGRGEVWPLWILCPCRSHVKMPLLVRSKLSRPTANMPLATHLDFFLIYSSSASDLVGA